MLAQSSLVPLQRGLSEIMTRCHELIKSVYDPYRSELHCMRVYAEYLLGVRMVCSCEGFRMPAPMTVGPRARGRRPQTCKGGNRGKGYVGGAACAMGI